MSSSSLEARLTSHVTLCHCPFSAPLQGKSPSKFAGLLTYWIPKDVADVASSRQGYFQCVSVGKLYTPNHLAIRPIASLVPSIFGKPPTPPRGSDGRSGNDYSRPSSTVTFSKFMPWCRMPYRLPVHYWAETSTLGSSSLPNNR